MLTDARGIPSGTVLEREVCVIGAGAAGIALALELAGAPFRVALLESGGLEPEPDADDLSRGRIYGRAYPPLHEVRTRRFGGSTWCWDGLCRPLEEIDLAEREWVPHSGWPFGLETLRPYYARARRVCGLEDPDDAPDPAADGPALPLGPELVETRALQLAPTRFGEAHHAAIAAARNVDAFLHASAVELRCDEAASRVLGVRVATLAGGGLELRARVFVLAAGGIENPRLLLASNRVVAQGIGNAHDLVGRYFMEHPQVAAAAFLPLRSDLALGRYQPRPRGRVRECGILVPTPDAQRRERILDFEAALGGEAALPGFERSLARAVRALEGAGAEPPEKALFVVASAEQAPNPQSRVRLAPERDALGVPRAQLEWRLSALDKRSLVRGYRLVGRALAGAGLGRLQVLLGGDDAEWPDELAVRRHHMGTTRMHPDPRQGVVDAGCRVHGVGNLYVAGSSVFPTSGAAPPTLTLVALAIRLADRLKEALA